MSDYMRCFRRCFRCHRYEKEYNNEINLEKLGMLKNNNPSLILIDVRSPQEYAEGHMPGSICVPSYDIHKMANKILPDKQAVIAIYCENGIRSRKAVNMLKSMGYKNVYNLII